MSAILNTRTLTLLIVCLTLLACNNAPPPEPPATKPALTIAEMGMHLYEQKCTACHGPDGTAGIAGAANLQTSKLDSTAIQQTITNGKAAMPAFKTQLTQTEITQLTAYVLVLNRR